MPYSITTVSLFFFFSSLLALSFGMWLLNRKGISGSGYLAIGEFIAGWWAFCGGMEVASQTLGLKILWSQLSYLSIATSPLMYFLFTLEYGQIEGWITRKKVLFMLIVPFLVILFALTNSIHKLLWPEVHLINGGAYAVYSQGPVFWLNVVYQYLLLVIGLGILVSAFYRLPRYYKPQIILIIGASILPYIANFLYISRLLPFKGLDITPLSFILMLGLIALGIMRFRLFDLVPLARKQVLDTIRAAVIVLDREERIVDLNPATEQIIGKKSNRMIGFPLIEFIPWLAMYLAEQQNKPYFNIEITLNEKFYDLQCSVLLGKKGQAWGKILVIRDITAKKETEDMLISANTKLKKEIKERELAIADLDAFAHTVAHDLKNPIGSLIGVGELMDERLQNDSQELKTYTEIVRQSGYRMLRIVNELLLLASVRKIDVERKPLDMKAVLEEVKNRLKEMIDEYHASIIETDAWPMVMGYGPWIEEVWTNYISNGIKYGGTPPVLKLHAEYTNGNQQVLLSIQDNGNGLPPAVLDKLFNEYVRFSELNVEGSGLGLSIVKRIVEKLGGKVSVTSENEPGKGCLFSFILPAAVNQE